MTYQGSFNDLIYAKNDRTPSVARYRIACFDDGADMRAVIHLAHFANPVLSSQGIDADTDAALNKIIDIHFGGVRIDHVHLVVEAVDGMFEYPIDFDANEFHRRGNPATLQGSGKSQALSIDSKDVVGGSVSFFASSVKRHALSAAVENALR
ncbi:hypothetical protein AWB64_04817 [Caballeronia sordidicola]|uniref:Uncharacterized protein n=1 Tax=Caballeronia sordidicola TaxID=196367 RepID=A0A158HNF2_CABSO|nr:hypothetical protein [Caballeronia sordidicola]SAL45607.1 hypothetical protein AWB64_04817 [Caballeronia sordidicola]